MKPPAAGGLEALHLLDYVKQTTLAFQPGRRVCVLPLEKESYEGGLGHRLHLPAETSDGGAVDAGQYTPVSEFLFV